MSEQYPTSAESLTSSSAMADKQLWHEQFAASVAESQQTGEPLSVAFIDVNYFKEINDGLGHERGDQVIADIKFLLTSNLRSGKSSDNNESRHSDEISARSISTTQVNAGHIGGDEFAVMAKTDETGVDTLTSRIKQSFNDYLNREGNEDLRKLGNGGISLAIGVATLQPGMTASELLKTADEAMYEDKLQQLPELTDKQRRAVKAARFLLEDLGVRLRDVAKYDSIIDNDER